MPFEAEAVPNPEAPPAAQAKAGPKAEPGGSSAGEEPGPPKRKYNTSERSRAASRENLKTNQAPHWLKYRLTDRRRAACYKSLEKAVAEMCRFDSPHYGLGFRRGTHCASLIRSLALAGETREEHEAPGGGCGGNGTRCSSRKGGRKRSRSKPQ